jgi:molecular chaperone DnaJ
MQDYYTILGVERNSDAETIKRAYRKIAMMHHPDRKPGDAESESKFKDAAEAYAVLSDPQKKAKYDRHSQSGFGFSLNDIFGVSVSGKTPQKGADVHITLNLQLKDLFQETSHAVNFHRREGCGDCKGQGVKSGRQKPDCSSCKGSGRIERNYISGYTHRRKISQCESCGGSGKVATAEDACTTCNGHGSVDVSASIKVTVPQGMPLDRPLVIAREGSTGVNGGPKGDVYVRIVPSPHSALKINVQKPYELICELRIPFWMAVFGGSKTIEAADGSAFTINVPERCQGGTVERVKGAGLPIFGRSERGDLVIIYQIIVPEQLTAEMRTLVENMYILEGFASDGKKSK